MGVGAVFRYFQQIEQRVEDAEARIMRAQQAQVERLSGLDLNDTAEAIMTEHTRSSLSGRLQAGQFEAWAREGVEIAKNSVYPRSLRRGRLPSDAYRRNAFETAKEAIALGGYRLAALLNELFGS